MFARVPALRFAGIAMVVAMPLFAQSAPKKPSRAKAVAGKIVDTTATSAATIAADSLLGSRGAAMTQAVYAAQMAQSAQMSAAYAAAAGMPQCASGTFPVPVVMGGPGAPTPAGSGVAGVATAAAASALPSIPSVPTPGGLVVGLAKKKLFGFGKKKDTAQAPTQASAIPPAATTAGDGRAQFQCMTVAQAQAYQQAVQNGTNASMMSALAGSAASGAANQASAASAQKDVMKTAAATALAVSPAGMMVTGAAAAAPTAGKALHALGSRFGRGGQNKESMQKDLAGGRLELKAIKFAAGSDDPSEGFEQTLATVVEAMQGANGGHFVLVVPAERDASGSVNVELAQRRTMRLAMHLALAGIPEALLTAGDPAQPNVGGGDKPPKAGDARPLILRAAVAQP